VSAQRKSTGRPRGRSIAALLLVGFVIVATAVIWRRGYGVAKAAELSRVTRHRDQLRAERMSLERRIGELTGRTQLEGVAERQLDMHVPADSQVIMLPAPASLPTGEGPRATP
jgi:cell division protein FtsL